MERAKHIVKLGKHWLRGTKGTEVQHGHVLKKLQVNNRRRRTMNINNWRVFSSDRKYSLTLETRLVYVY